MVMFDNIEEIFQTWRDFNDYTKALVTLATAAGTILILTYSLKFIYSLCQGFRLYVLRQICCKANLTKYGQWAVVSGSTDGIGLAMAKELARMGHSIVVIGRNETKLARTKVMLEEEPNVGDVVTVKIDLADSSIENYATIRDQIDPDNRDIGVLINNAGVYVNKFNRFNRIDIETLVETVNVNILATVHLTRMIMPGMIERGRGLIVNVSSTLGLAPAPYMGLYGATKTFMNRFTDTLRIEYSDHPIDIVNITPGPVHTKLFEATKTILTKPTAINPTPEDYARSTLNAIPTGIRSFSGTMTHGLMKIMFNFNSSLGLNPVSFSRYLLRDASSFSLSPVPKRKAPLLGHSREERPSE